MNFAAAALAALVVVGDGVPQPLTATPGDAARGRAIVANRQLGLCLLCHRGPIPDDALAGLTALPFVRDSATRTASREVRIPVEDASVALPELTAWSEQHGFDLESVAEHQPDYDDVFVRLMQQAEDNFA